MSIATLIIPIYNPNYKFYKLLRSIKKQLDLDIIIIDSGSINLNTKWLQGYPNLKLISIDNKDFNHGGTRNLGAKCSTSDFLIFMTQDAVPKNFNLIKELLFPFRDPQVAAVYARQIAFKDAGVIEKHSRKFNYPSYSIIKTKHDIGKMGIKTFFISNACSAYRSKDFFDFGAFPEDTICNEDMIMSSKLILGGKKIVYNSNAQVFHSHNYTNLQLFKRNFDIGVSLKQNSDILKYAYAEQEGISYIINTFKYFLKRKKMNLVIDLLIQSFFKFLGYRLGLNNSKIPRRFINLLSLNARYWTSKSE